jgi:hypothetical protein
VDINTLLIGAGAGAVAALLARMIADPGEKKTAYVFLFVLLFAGLNLAGRTFILPKLQLRNVEASLLEESAFRALKEHEPETFDQILAEVKGAMKDGKKPEQLRGLVRKHLAEMVEERLPSASNEAVTNYISATMVEVDELYERGDELCFEFLFPKDGKFIDASKYFSKEALQADLDALSEVIESSATDPQDVPQESEVMPELQPIMAELVAFYGEDFAQLQNPHAPGVDKRQACEITSSMYTKILDLPSENSGRILRFLIAGS